MFAAAATIAQMVFDAALMLAKWLATKALILSMLAVVLPWVLRKVIIWAFEWLSVYGREFFDSIMSFIQTQAGAANLDIDINLTGVGGYLAVQTGLIDYASIIFTGWGLYWIVAILAKTPRAVL